jgi:photosystem II stability/assembly factor-like uncharacterized protein
MNRFKFFVLFVVLLSTNFFPQSSQSYSNIFFLDDHNGWVLSNRNYLWKTTDAGSSWISIYDSRIDTSGKIIFIDEQNGRMLLNNNLYSSHDGGLNWQHLYSFPVFSGNYDVSFSNDSIGFVSNFNNLYRTVDGGDNWNQLTDTLGTINNISTFRENLLFISTEGETISRVFKSTDEGELWLQVADFGGIYGSGFGKVQMLSETTGILTLWYADFIAVSVLLKTTDAGDSWEQFGNQFTFGFSLTDFEFRDLQRGWVTTNNKNIFRTIDEGQTWDTLQTPLTLNEIIKNFEFFNSDTSFGISDNHIYKTIDGWITYSIVDSIVTGLEQHHLTAAQFKLHQNYPNPFNGFSIIKYSIPQLSNVTIKIFNTLGEELETLIDQEKPAGTYEVKWNAINLPSGIYFYQLKSGSFIETKKMLLLK